MQTFSRLALAVFVMCMLGIGVTAANAAIVADSAAEFSGVQGQAGWRNGYHNLTANGPYDANPVGTDDFIEFGPGGDPGFVFTGTQWDYAGNVNPPWTEIGASNGHPNGPNNAASGGEQWAIRRWTSDVSGAANIEFQVNKTNLNGDGVTSQAFVNGVEQGAITIGGTDGVGKTWTVHVPNLKVGDFVDASLNATGLTGVSDGSDGSNFSAKVDLVSPQATTLIADSIADFSGTQGQNNWRNGYHNVTANGAYDANPGGTDDFIEFGPGGDAGFTFNGTNWDFAGNVNPPWTFIGPNNGHPNGTNNAGVGGEQFAIRRYIAEQSGDMFVEAFLAAENTNGGNGTILHVFHNGIDMGMLTVGGTDGIGLTDVFELQAVRVGDFIDIALDPNGPDGSDGSLFSARIFAKPVVPEPAAAMLALMGLASLGLRRRRAA